MTSACVCRSCVDPRESGLHIQHKLPLFNDIYMNRVKGSFIAPPLEGAITSNTAVMLIGLGRNPVYIVQGHHDCAAVAVLFNSFGKPDRLLNATETEFRRSHGEALNVVQANAQGLSRDHQLALTEKACILQSINNLLLYPDIKARNLPENRLNIYAYFSQTPVLKKGEKPNPEKIGLMIFDPAQSLFVPAIGDNEHDGFRISDTIDLKTFTPRNERFKITNEVNLVQFVKREVETILCGEPKSGPGTVRKPSETGQALG